MDDTEDRALEIVRLLAACEPWVDAAASIIAPTDYSTKSDDWKCALCGIGAADQELDEAKHAPACPWALAIEMVKMLAL